jgi:hypothetical protein
MKWLRRIRGALGMGLVWALGGAGVGGLFELIDNILPGALPFIANIDMWPQTLAIPGFLGGVIFGAVIGVARGQRRFEEFSLGQFAGWGALAGAVVALLTFAVGASVSFAAFMAVLGTVGGAASLALARMAAGRGLLEAAPNAAAARLAEGDPTPPAGA